MAAWVAELPVRIYYGDEVTGFAQDDTGADVELSDGRSLRAQYVVGCDGGASVIRKTAGIEFPGWDPTKSNLIAEVEMTEEPPRASATTQRASMVSTGWRMGGRCGSS
jgi:2-polyprenyl-6-methoxyphenol hydroxylase-like FAD-dependent oxidoreductase